SVDLEPTRRREPIGYADVCYTITGKIPKPPKLNIAQTCPFTQDGFLRRGPLIARPTVCPRKSYTRSDPSSTTSSTVSFAPPIDDGLALQACAKRCLSTPA